MNGLRSVAMTKTRPEPARPAPARSTPAASTAWQHLDLLRAELERRGWIVHLRGTPALPTLHVCNPQDRDFHDAVSYRSLGPSRAVFCWHWGPEIADVHAINDAADKITYILRGVSAQ